MKRSREQANGNKPALTAKPNAKQKREDVKPAQFTHPSLASREKKWLCPGDALFKDCSEHSYKGLRVERAATFSRDVHTQFKGEPKTCTQLCDECVQCKPPACCSESAKASSMVVADSFDALHEGGLFLYDMVQAGGKRLSSTYVTRTLVGEAGITYKYLGLRIFAHPWDGGGEGCTPFIGPAHFRHGSSSSSNSSNSNKKQKRSHSATATTTAAAVNSSTATAEVQEDAAVTVLWGGATGFKPDKKVAAALQQLGELSQFLQRRAVAACAAEGITDKLAAVGQAPGSANFNLTLINSACTASTSTVAVTTLRYIHRSSMHALLSIMMFGSLNNVSAHKCSLFLQCASAARVAQACRIAMSADTATAAAM
eukprot:7922-Heterococcus_DN1.PRE.4